jgi:hypothetical protein
MRGMTAFGSRLPAFVLWLDRIELAPPTHRHSDDGDPVA